MESPSSRTPVAPDLAVIILTRNEAVHIRRCIDALEGLSAEVFVVDSGSTDGTVEIARSAGAHVVEHPFDTHARQFNWALDALPLTAPWVIRVDADEYLLPGLRQELVARIRTAEPDLAGLELRVRVVVQGRWIRHGGTYPVWLLRAFRRGAGRYADSPLNEHLQVQGRIERLQGDFVNEDLRSLADWSRKHIWYAERQAKLLAGGERDGIEARWRGASANRRRWLYLRLYRRFPALLRPFLLFGYRYIIQRGFLDGREGLIFHFLQGCWYPFLTDVILAEQERARRSGGAR